jgi:putative membrane protein
MASVAPVRDPKFLTSAQAFLGPLLPTTTYYGRMPVNPQRGGIVDLVATSFSTLPSFLAYFAGGGVLLAAFIALYVHTTPHQEVALIREGNTAAAIALSGAVLGFVLPLAIVIANSASLIDVLVWGVIAIVVQLGGFLVARAVLPGLSKAICDGQVSDAIFLAGLSLALGILDAACMAG